MATQRTRPSVRLMLPGRLQMGLAGLLIGLVVVNGATGGDGPPLPKPIDFAHDVAPLIKAHCAKCHTDGTYKGSFSLDTRETMLKSKADRAGEERRERADRAAHVRRPRVPHAAQGSAAHGRRGRPAHGVDRPGSPVGAGFTFKRADYTAPLKLRRPKLPAARDGRDHPIDRIVDAYFAAHGVSPPPPLDDAAFARRAFLDVIGLLPPPRELEAFENDASPDKRARLTRRLLDDRRAYADHWLSFWNDLLRNDYAGTGYIDGGRKPITAWLYRALIDNKPYDRFVRELISPTAGIGGVHQGDQVARAGQRQPGPRDPVLAERLAGVLRHQHEVRLLPRQLHRPLEARRRLWPGGRDRRRAAGDRPLRQADGPDRPARSSSGPSWGRSTPASRETSGWSGWPSW